MGREFDIRRYRTFEELAIHGSAELAPDDLLVHKQFGHNVALTADSAEDLWDLGGTRDIFTAAELFNIVSDDVADTAAGTGARMVKIVGLDGSYNLQTETVTLNGTTNVPTVNSYIHIHKMEVILSGSGRGNAGAISATGVTSSNIIATITIGESKNHQSHFMVPAGYTCFLVNAMFATYRSSGTGRKSAEFLLKEFNVDTNTISLIKEVGVSSESVYMHNGHCKRQFPPKTLIWVEAVAESANTSASCQLDLMLIKEDLNFRTEI